MANIRLEPPEPFDFKTPDEWEKWRRRFEQFRVASGLSGESGERQVCTLLYCLGEEAENVLSSMNVTAEERGSYVAVLKKFNDFFKVRKNIIFERVRFNRRAQRDGESVEQYISDLYSLAENCEYGAMKDEMIRDRLVVGLLDCALSERLQLDPELTLEKAKRAARQKEAVQEQQQSLRSDLKVPGTTDVDVVGQQRREQVRGPNTHSTVNLPNIGRTRCGNCGRGPHTRENCPARRVACHSCGKQGHFSAHCRSKEVLALSVPGFEEDVQPAGPVFLGTLDNEGTSTWTVDVVSHGKLLRFKIDTGAEVTAISETTYESLGKTQLLRKCAKTLYGPSAEPLHILGVLQMELKYSGRVCHQPVYVIKGLKGNLLGLPAIQSLQLLSRINSIDDYSTNIYRQFPNLFRGLGIYDEPYHIKLKPNATPHCVYTARNIPIPYFEKVKLELTKMESSGVISQVDVPTEWCAAMVAVPKKTDSLRICVDLRPLNECVLREVHPLPKVDVTLASLSGARVFSKLDANSGFWQIPLSEESRLLTTFITPFGRYCFNKLPFGIASAPEHFQKVMNKVLSGLDGIVCQMDDTLVFGKSQEEHDKRLLTTLSRIQSAGLTLNKEKCLFSKCTITFLGHVIDSSGVSPDPEKIAAIKDMPPPKNISDLRRFMGMVTQLGKFTPNLAELSQPLRELLSTKRCWCWGPDQVESFTNIKTELTKPAVLAFYNPANETKVSADASSHGLGAVLLQMEANAWKPVAFASRSMSSTEVRYAQIEKEALAATWACERFRDYLVGKRFCIETDHKPLVPLLSSTHLDNLPPRVLRFRLRLMRFDYSIVHVPGKLLYTADTLSRAPTTLPDADSNALQDEVEGFVSNVTKCLPATEGKLQTYRVFQASDPECVQIMKYCRFGWPEKHCISDGTKPYWVHRGLLTIQDGLLLFGSRIVVPRACRRETLDKIHSGHLGIQRCKLRVQQSVWWPGVSKEIESLVKHCRICARTTTTHKEPMIVSQLPDYPWQKVGSDLFEFKGHSYIVLVDYFSRFLEVIKLTATTTSAIISIMKAVFSRHGIPELLISDNGPQYQSHEMKQFSQAYGFVHVTSSPHYPQSNGEAERAVQTAKRLLGRSEDPFVAVLSYNATPMPWCNLSPSELLMGRKLRSTIPQTTTVLIPGWPYLKEFKVKNRCLKEKQKIYYDQRHQTRSKTPLEDGTEVWVSKDGDKIPGTVTAPASTPRSYLVQTPAGQLRRNRSHLTEIPSLEDAAEASTEDQLSEPDETEPVPQAPPRSPIMTRTRTGTAIRPPLRF